MYDTSGPMSEGGMKKCKPDYEQMAAKQGAELIVIENFKQSLLEFIAVIGQHSFKREQSSIPELLGFVELDIINRQKQYERSLDMLEKNK